MNTVHENSIPFVYKNILTDNLSGTLEIKTPQFDINLFFEEGTMVFGSTSREGDRLGNLLIKAGKIVPDKLSEIWDQAEKSNQKLGILLVKNGIINQKELYRILIMQMKKIASTAFFTKEGYYHFSEEIPELPGDSRFTINIAEIIRQSCTQISDPVLFRNNFHNMIPQPGKLSARSKKILEQEDIALAREISTLNHMLAADISQYLNISDKIYWNRLYFFFLTGLINFREPELSIDEDTVITRETKESDSKEAEPEKTKEISETAKQIEELYTNFQSGKLNYYQYLSIENNASKEQIREAYFKMAKQFHPDRIADDDGEEILDKANFVFTSINRAYEVLSHTDQKSEYDAAGQKDASTSAKDDLPPAEKASTAYKTAQNYYKKNELVKACALLEEAVKNDAEKSNYHYLLGVCQASISHKRRDAEKSFLKSAELNPWDSKPFVALARFFIQEGLKSRAIHYVQKALEIDPENKHVIKMHENLTGKGKKNAGSVPFGWLFGKKK